MEILRNEKGFLITYKDIAGILGKEEDAIKKRAYRKSNFQDEELFKIAKHYEIDYSLINAQKEERETIVVDYYENNKVGLKKNPAYKNYYMDRELAKSYNPNYKDSDFKIICALDDTLDGGVLWIHEKDVVLLDVTYTNVDKPGMYVYECQNGKYLRASFINKLMDGTYSFTYPNPKYKEQIRTAEYLEEVKFRVVGRIIKNLMFFA